MIVVGLFLMFFGFLLIVCGIAKLLERKPQEAKPMTPPQLFRALLSVWRINPTNPSVDLYARELIAHLADQKHLCLGIIRRDALPKLFGLVYYIERYGVTLSSTYRQDDTITLYLTRPRILRQDYAKSVVVEQVTTKRLELPA